MSDASNLPQADVRPTRRLRLSWLLPLGALALVLHLGRRAWEERGLQVQVRFEQGHGIKAGDAVRFRGIAVGEVAEVQLDRGMRRVVLQIAVDNEARALARVGTRFWIVRPEVSMAGIAGLETIVGARYLGVLPGPEDAPRQTLFQGLEESPVEDGLEVGGLELVLSSQRKGSLSRSAPIHYRQIEVGRVLSVGLASDGNAVAARVYIEPAYAGLVRAETRFWRVSGIDVQMDFTGFHLKTESLQTLARGGIAMATPPDSHREVSTGHRFEIHESAEEEWLAWQPSIPVGSALIQSNSGLPRPLRATARWEDSTLIFQRSEQRSGWLLSLEAGLVGPLSLLRPNAEDGEGAVLQVAGQSIDLAQALVWERGGLGCLAVDELAPRWASHRVRAAEVEEDCLLLADPSAPALAIDGSRLVQEGDNLLVDPSLPIDAQWHGAAVVARSDGALVGVLLVDSSGGSIAPLVD